MDRNQLKQLMATPGTKQINMLEAHKRLAQKSDGEAPTFFRTPQLNRCVLFKFLDIDGYEYADNMRGPLKTLIYFPYIRDMPTDGGEAFFHSETTFRNFCELNASETLNNQADFAHDLERLRIFDQCPSFNPFLVEEAFDRAGVPLPPRFFNGSVEENHEMRARIRTRLRPLIVAALGDQSDQLNESLEVFVEKLWRTDDIVAITPLISALGIKGSEASEVVSSWIGLTFFEHEFLALQPELTVFTEWMRTNYLPREYLDASGKEHLLALYDVVRKQMRDAWRHAIHILQEYQKAYDKLLNEPDGVGAFVKFLKSAKENYWALGQVLGLIEQSIYAWRHFTEHYNNEPLPYRRLYNMYEVLARAI
ncbi:MAG: hypothetical protein AAF869_08570 [Pseudomonadota bacterium]